MSNALEEDIGLDRASMETYVWVLAGCGHSLCDKCLNL